MLEGPTQLSLFAYKGRQVLSSPWTWNRARLGPGVVKMVVISGLGTQLVYCLCLTEVGRSLNSFAVLKGNVYLLSPKGLESQDADSQET